MNFIKRLFGTRRDVTPSLQAFIIAQVARGISTK